MKTHHDNRATQIKGVLYTKLNVYFRMMTPGRGVVVMATVLNKIGNTLRKGLQQIVRFLHHI